MAETEAEGAVMVALACLHATVSAGPGSEVGAVAFGAAMVAILAAKAGTQDAYEEVAVDLQQKA